jgi:hypothetical protein
MPASAYIDLALKCSPATTVIVDVYVCVCGQRLVDVYVCVCGLQPRRRSIEVPFAMQMWRPIEGNTGGDVGTVHV